MSVSGQAAGLPKYPFCLGQDNKAAAKPPVWHAHGQSPPRSVTQTGGCEGTGWLVEGEWTGGREGGRGEGGRMHLSPHSTTPRVGLWSIWSQERGRHAGRPRLAGGRRKS